MNFLRFTALFITLIVILTACQSEKFSTEAPNRQPEKLDTKANYGMLAAPVYDDTLVELNTRDIRLKPEISDTRLRGGRYFHPCFINDTTFAVACLRGVDIYTVPDDINSIEPAIRIDTPGHAWSVTPVAKNLWVADGYAGVQVINPQSGEIVAQFPELTNTRAFHTMADGRIVVCRHSSGVNILTSKSGLVIDNQMKLDVESRVFCATSSDTTIYLGTLGGGYIAYKPDDTGQYSPLWTYNDCTRILWCHTDGQYHYLLDRDVGLRVLKSSSDRAPQQVALLQLDGQWRHGCMKNETTLLVAHETGLLEIDNAIPEKPAISQFFKSPLDSRGVAFHDGHVVITDSEYGLRLLKSDNAKSTLAAQHIHDGLVADVAIQPELLLLSHTHRGTHRFKWSAATLDSNDTWTTGNYQTAVDVNGSIMAIADYAGIILLESVSGKPLKKLSGVTTPGRTVNVTFHGDLLLVSDWFDGLRILDVSNPVKPQWLSQIDTTGWAIDAAAHGNYAYVCCVNQGLMTIDISDPRHPIVTHIDSTGQAPEGIALGNGCLYMADFNFGLLVFDLTDPAKPFARACWKTSVCKSVQIRDDILLLCNYIYGLKWFDISEPFQPVLIGELDTWSKSYEAVFVPGEQAVYVADWHDLLKVTW
ncbi:hypothetical protein K8T06_11570 [bacterium]|nr:hypothetical protein [bacterium]